MERDGTGPEGADPGTNTSALAPSNSKNNRKQTLEKVKFRGDHSNEGTKGESADGHHDATQSQQAKGTKAPPTDRAICTKETHCC